MNRLLSAGCLGLAMAAAVAASVASGEHAPVRKAHPAVAAAHGRVIVKLREHAGILSASTAGGARLGPKAAVLLGNRLHIALDDGRAIGPRTQVLKSSSLDSKALAARIAQDPEVEWAVVDQRRFPLSAPSDPLYPNNLSGTTPVAGQWYLRAPDSVVKSGIDIEAAWAVTHGTGIASTSAVVIADLDTGITSHDDLVNKLLPGYDFVGFSAGEGSSGIATANDGDAADANPTDPGDWITAAENQGGEFKGCADNGTGDAVAEDSSWHGTQTAGILGAQTN
ncbi:MAG TPA: S8 family serine peptidase, partial [Burkholderiaceae bacterium]